MKLLEDKPKWEPQPGDRVIYKYPAMNKECGLFVICRPVFSDEINLPDDYCNISHRINKGRGQPAEIRERELKRRLELGPEKPCAKFCKSRKCEFYKPRECSGVHECTLTELTPSNLNICPKDEEELNNNQFMCYGDFPRDFEEGEA